MASTDLAYRSICFGSLKTFPPGGQGSLKVSEDGLDLQVCLNKDFSIDVAGEETKYNIKITSDQIDVVEAYLHKDCPLIWLSTNTEHTNNIHRMTKMLPNNSGVKPFYDPESPVMAEQRIVIFPTNNPVRPLVAKNFRKCAASFAKKNGFVELTQDECNARLLQFTTHLERMAKGKLQPNVSKISAPSISAETIGKEIGSSGEKEMESLQDMTKIDDTLLQSPVSNSKMSVQQSSDVSISSVASLSLSPPSGSKKIHRARKSIPSHNRVAGIESQLRAREQSATKIAEIRSEIVKKRKRVDEEEQMAKEMEENEDSNSLPDSNGNGGKKKRPKDPFLLKGRSKKRIKKTNSNNENGKDDSKSSDIVVCAAQDLPPRSVKATASLSSEMQSLLHDTESMMRMSALCTCIAKSPYVINLNCMSHIACMAIDNVGGRLSGCVNPITDKVMMRPSKGVPVQGLCEGHRERMIRHECCPGCGTFCAGGQFLVCASNEECPHRFHKDCMLLTRHTMDCPHCGSNMSLVREVNINPTEDNKLRWILAGKDPIKMEKKTLLAMKRKNARMGYKTALEDVEQPIVGITRKLSDAITFSTNKMMMGPDRDELEIMLKNLDIDMHKKLRFQAKTLMQLIKQNETVKIIQLFCSGEQNIRCSIPSTAIHEAVKKKNIAVCHLLLQAGSDVNTEDDEGKTPLFYAEESTNVVMIDYLLGNNADILHQDCEGMMCIHHAAKGGRIRSCAALLRYRKLGINCPDEGGWTPIVWAAEHKQLDTAKYLAHFGADVHKLDKEGNICLQWAALAGNKDVLLLCLHKHSNVNHQNMHGDTALHIAARENNYECVVCLLGWSANPTIRNKDNYSAFECAPQLSMSWMSLKINATIRSAICPRVEFTPLNRERILSADLSRGYENVPVICVNAVDDTRCPTDPPGGFLYVVENVHTSMDTKIQHVVSSITTCQCENDCTSESCICGVMSERCWYTAEGLLLPDFPFEEPPLLFECTKLCRCSKTCTNRVVQKGIQYRLQVHRTHGMGWGVRTLETIPKGAFVCEYVGELISDAEADIREDDSYLFDLENNDGEIFCIDARSYGNVSRFINHLCEPNLVPIRVFVEHHDIRFPHLAYFSTREIKAGEELGFDYGSRFWDVKCRQFTCECGSHMCKYSKDAYAKKHLLEKMKEAEEAENKAEMMEVTEIDKN